MLPGGHGSADPGSGMNRAPERLSLAVVVLVVLVSVALAGRISALTGDRQLRLP